MQYFFLVAINYDESTSPKKIFFQEESAVKWGRRRITELSKKDSNYSCVLYRQPILATGELEMVRYLTPFEKGMTYQERKFFLKYGKV